MPIKIRTRFLKNRLTAIILVFGMVMVGFGLLLYQRLDDLLIEYEKRAVMQYAKDEAAEYSEKLKSELSKLKNSAEFMESETSSGKKGIYNEMTFFDETYKNRPNVFIGLMDAKCEAVYGSELSPREYLGIQDSLRGQGGISYTNGGGILFSYPVMRAGNVRYILYELCASSYFMDNFRVSMLDGKADVGVMTRSGEVLVPIQGQTGVDPSFYESDSVLREYSRLIRKMDIETMAGEYRETTEGGMYFFTADVYGTNFVIAGTVKKSMISSGLEDIPRLVMLVFFFLLLMVIALAVFLMVSSQRLQESSALKHAKEAAEEASKAKTDFLANMSHEIRTPINTVLGMDEMILREYDDETLRGYAMNIQSAGKSLLSLVNDVLDFSRIEAGKMELIPDDYELSVMIMDMVAMMNTQAAKKGLKLKLEVDETTPHILYGDSVRLRQVIVNLLSNAVKYTHEGTITFSVGYEALDRDHISLKVSVQDTGIGIRKEDMNKLFVEFERLDENQNRTIEGTGLGMNIVRKLLALMGSEPKVESVYGEGSTFSFEVKQEVLSWESIGDIREAFKKAMKREEVYHPSFRAPDAKILLVDDIDMNIVVINGLLKHSGIEIDTASNGKEALAETEKKVYDLLIVDHKMPIMDGIQMITALRADEDNPNNRTPSIALTANAVSGARADYLSVGFDEYLIKPVEAKRLEQVLMEFLPDEKVQTDVDAKEIQPVSVTNMAEAAKPAEEPAAEEEESFRTRLEKAGMIDSEEGISYAGDDTMFGFALQFFCDGVEEKASEIEGYYDSEDWENYVIKVHGLKSSAKVIGAKDLSEQARLLELAGKDMDLAYIHEHTREVMDFYRKYKT